MYTQSTGPWPGLTSEHILEVEDVDLWTKFFGKYLDDHKPWCLNEYELVTRMATSAWLSHRYRGVEACLVDDSVDTVTLGLSKAQLRRHVSFHFARGYALLASGKVLSSISNHARRSHRDYDDALRLLIRSRKAFPPPPSPGSTDSTTSAPPNPAAPGDTSTHFDTSTPKTPDPPAAPTPDSTHFDTRHSESATPSLRRGRPHKRARASKFGGRRSTSRIRGLSTPHEFHTGRPATSRSP